MTICTLMVPPGATGRSSGTSITVRSSVLPSSGAMKRMRAVRSPSAAPASPITRTLVTSIQPQSASGRDGEGRVAGEAALAHPGRVGVAPRVVIKMELERRGGAVRRVAPREDLVARQRTACAGPGAP